MFLGPVKLEGQGDMGSESDCEYIEVPDGIGRIEVNYNYRGIALRIADNRGWDFAEFGTLSNVINPHSTTFCFDDQATSHHEHVVGIRGVTNYQNELTGISFIVEKDYNADGTCD